MEHAFVNPQRKPNRTTSSKHTTRGRQGTGSKNNKKTTFQPQGMLVVLRGVSETNSVVRHFSVGVTLSSSATGVIPQQSPGGATIITALGAEWSNFAQEFQQYRIRKLGFHFFPCTTAATSTTGPYQGGMIATNWQQNALSNTGSIEQSAKLIKWSTLEEKNPWVLPSFENAKLWNDATIALPVDRDYGLSYASVGALALNSQIFQVLYEMEVEFRLPR